MPSNAPSTDDRCMEFRIGVNLGDVIIEGDDIHGDGVNVAARLEALAEPGGVCVSGDVYRQCRGKLDVGFDDLGEQEVKNIAEPVRTYRVRIDAAAATTEDGAEALPLPDKPSIAVLAFENMSGDPEQEYFADGIAEDVITGLSRIRWIFVIARNSSFTFKGKAVDVRHVGRELGVRYVLEGSVRKGNNRIRITAQLVEAATGNHLWADRFDGELEDVFDLQDQITAQVVGAIEPSMQVAEIDRSRRKRPDSLDAYDLYLRALPHIWAFTPSESSKALDLLQAAIEIDPSFASAHGLLARTYQQKYLRAGNDPTDKKLAIEHSRTVLALRSDDSNALAFAGLVLAFLDHDYDTARGAVDKALEINPNSAQGLGSSALVNTLLGRHDDAISQAEQSIRLSPFNPNRYTIDLYLSYAHFCCGRYSEAAEAARRAIQSNPLFIPAQVLLAACQVRLGQMDEARKTSERVLEIEPNFRFGGSIGMVTAGQPGDAENVAAALREVGLLD